MPIEKIIDCHRSVFSSIVEIDEDALIHVDTNELLHMADGSEPAGSIATRVGIEWNDNGLLVYFRGRFEQLREPEIMESRHRHEKTQALWKSSDVFEVFISTRARDSGRYMEFQISPDGRWLDIDVHQRLGVSNYFWYSGFQCKSFVDREMQIWSSIFELPWNCFGLNTKTDDIWDINFYRASGLQGDEMMAWSATGYGEGCFHRPEHFGRIHFIQ